MAQSTSRPGDAQVEVRRAYRSIPSVDRLLGDRDVQAATALVPEFAGEVIRKELERIRDRIANGLTPAAGDVKADVIEALKRRERPRLGMIINGTGVIIHTNLGRAPVSGPTGDAMLEAACHAVALEIDIGTGARGGRMAEISGLMELLTSAQSSVVVNNNAAAVLLVLSALARGRQVIVSRGEAVEIGGGFRIPEVLAQSGASLVEVGTTNRTYARDYADAVTEQTACFLKVHPSNFEITGFTHQVSIAELAEVGRSRGIPVVEDLGSGALLDTAMFGLETEPTIGERLRAGAAVVTASGDKLLGGPQAGLIVGNAALIDRIAAHPLARAVRADKTCLAGIAMTLRHYARGEAIDQIPVWRMIAAPVSTLCHRADRMVETFRDVGIAAESIATVATVGGGSLPGKTLPSRGVGLRSQTARSLEIMAKHLRMGDRPIVPRIADDQVIVDLRTVLPEDDDALVDAVIRVMKPRSEPYAR